MTTPHPHEHHNHHPHAQHHPAPHAQHADDHSQHAHASESLTKVAFMATLHCLSGCAIGEVAGMAIATALGWSNTATIILATVLAFLSGYVLTTLPLLRGGLSLSNALRTALLADSASIAVMEVVDNLVMLFIPGAMNAPLSSPLFWLSLVISLVIAGIVAWPLNRWLIARGRGHAVVHAHH
jgi:hypothetical protein